MNYSKFVFLSRAVRTLKAWQVLQWIFQCAIKSEKFIEVGVFIEQLNAAQVLQHLESFAFGDLVFPSTNGAQLVDKQKLSVAASLVETQSIKNNARTRQLSVKLHKIRGPRFGSIQVLVVRTLKFYLRGPPRASLEAFMVFMRSMHWSSVVAISGLLQLVRR